MRYATIVIFCCLVAGFLEALEAPRLDDSLRAFSVSGHPGRPTDDRSRHLADPDTTSPERYFPLHVGDIWEYDMVGAPMIVRRDITGEIMIDGTRYFKWQTVRFENGIPISGTTYTVRYDEASSFVMGRFGDEEIAFGFAPCPLNADFGVTVDCEPFKYPGSDFWDSSGTNEGEVVFGRARPLTLADTVSTSIKRFDRVRGGVDVSIYAADIGQVHVENEFEIFTIYYARINGVEYGTSRIPTSDEAGQPDVFSPGMNVVAYPNPFTDNASLQIELSRPDRLWVAIYDTRGRRVSEQALGSLGAGRHVQPLYLAHVAPGRYVVRVTGADHHSTSILITKSTHQG